MQLNEDINYKQYNSTVFCIAISYFSNTCRRQAYVKDDISGNLWFHH